MALKGSTFHYLTITTSNLETSLVQFEYFYFGTKSYNVYCQDVVQLGGLALGSPW